MRGVLSLIFTLTLLWSKATASDDDDRLKIGSFNVQVFGVKKVQKEGVLPILTDIVQRYDVVLIQEIRDASGTAIEDLLGAINEASSSTYNYEISEPLGRTASKEQYAFLYRADRVEILNNYQYDDSAEDKFQREPYSVLVRSKLEGIPDFFLTVLHAEPGSKVTASELDALVEVYDSATEVFQTNNGVMMGDFNADCQYLSKTKFNALDLVNDERFTWLLDPEDYTTSGNTNCAYDRFVVAGDIGDHVVSESPQVFKFDDAYELDPDMTKTVSDHYPIEFHLQPMATGGHRDEL